MSKDTASFFENGTTEQFEYCFQLYPEVLRLRAEKKNKKPQELIRLDQWYQNDLPKLIKARGKDAHMIYDELVQTMKWKQSRGKSFPQLSYLVKVNTPRAVMTETKKAFRKLPNLEQAITALSNLKGVGTTMASALLAAASPDSAPFMADECLMAIPEIEGIDYTTKEYLNFVQHIQATVTRLNNQAGAAAVAAADKPKWSPHRVELALWAHYVANDLNPELLDEMPGAGISSNGKTKTLLMSGAAEDTNDADDESLEATAVVANAVIAENENTNSGGGLNLSTASAAVLQDGDSNFVSNDSTSQEQLLDENTTQTTATTSTDDGEAGTPLASDSESNLEAPTKMAAAAAASAEAEAANTLLPNNNLNKSHNASAAALIDNASNGNGTALTSSVGDSLDGENSSCLRASEDYDDLDDEEEEESSNSNNCHSRLHTIATPIINLSSSSIDNESSSLSSNLVAQKRSLLAEDNVLAASEPELKKIKAD